MLLAAFEVLVSARDDWKSAKVIFKALQAAAVCSKEHSSDIAKEKGFPRAWSYPRTSHIVATACMAREHGAPSIEQWHPYSTMSEWAPHYASALTAHCSLDTANAALAEGDEWIGQSADYEIIRDMQI